MNKQELAAKIWETANELRGSMEASEYKDYILGFIFYKYLSEQEVNFLLSKSFEKEDIEELTEEDEEDVKWISKNLGYFIEPKDLFQNWIKMGSDFTVDNVRTALSSFNRNIDPNRRKIFAGVFNTLEQGLSNLGDTATSQTKAIRQLVSLVNDVPTSNGNYDTLGYIYEYLISQFAAGAGKKAGEFYTPHEVSLVMAEIIANHLKDNETIKIYDPTSGSGSLLLNIGQAVSKYIDDPNKIKYYAQEKIYSTYNLTRMNLVMHEVLPDNMIIRNGDTLEHDFPYFEDSDPEGTYEPVFVDAVTSIVDRKFDDRAKLEIAVSDLTYVRVGSKWNYVCTLIDLSNREVIGYSAGANKDASLIEKALLRCKYSLKDIKVFHSDRGKEYDNIKIDNILETFNIERSLSRKGNPYDNAVSEAMNKILKTEFIYQNKFETLEELELQLAEYIYWYNHIRIHGSLGYISPVEYRNKTSLELVA